MILIADGGASKTDWAFVHSDGNRRFFSTSGYNPYYQDSRDWQDEIKKILSRISEKDIHQVYYYGAGCSEGEKRTIIHSKLSTLFPSSEILVQDDLLGAARAIWQHKPGGICILGTGTHTGYYDGTVITSNVTPMGFLIGDHGSSANLGRRFLHDYLYHQFPRELESEIEKFMRKEPARIKEELYQSATPNRYLGKFTKILSHCLTYPEVKALVKSEFSALFSVQIIPLFQGLPLREISFTGSVAYYFRDILIQVAAENGFRVNHIEQYPIRLLVDYHFNLKNQNNG